MPLNEAERKMKRNLEETYGKERGEKIFYAMERQGKTPNSDRSKTMMGKKKSYAMGGMTNKEPMMNNMGTAKPAMGMAKGGMAKKKADMAKGKATKKAAPKK